MHPSNIMWLLNDLDKDSNIEIHYIHNPYSESITIEAEDFVFICNNDYLKLYTRFNGKYREEPYDEKVYNLVKKWVKNYLTEVM